MRQIRCSSLKIIRGKFWASSLLAFLLPAVFICSCQTVPITGRQQLTLVDSGQLRQQSEKQYNQFLKDHTVVKDTTKAHMVKRVGRRIQNAVQSYMSRKGKAHQLKGYEWEFNLIKENAVNAWAMPGGKVVVYTGILPVAKTESGLAVIMGHEIAHVIARHGNERVSEGILVNLGAQTLSTALNENSETTQQVVMAAYGATSKVAVQLPHSREQESEADQLGLIFMAIAGYNPQEAPKFWQRMEQGSGNSPPEFLSTHPSHKTRIQDLKKWMPKAMEYYKNNTK